MRAPRFDSIVKARGFQLVKNNSIEHHLVCFGEICYTLIDCESYDREDMIGNLWEIKAYEWEQ